MNYKIYQTKYNTSSLQPTRDLSHLPKPRQSRVKSTTPLWQSVPENPLSIFMLRCLSLMSLLPVRYFFLYPSARERFSTLSLVLFSQLIVLTLLIRGTPRKSTSSTPHETASVGHSLSFQIIFCLSLNPSLHDCYSIFLPVCNVCLSAEIFSRCL